MVPMDASFPTIRAPRIESLCSGLPVPLYFENLQRRNARKPERIIQSRASYREVLGRSRVGGREKKKSGFAGTRVAYSIQAT